MTPLPENVVILLVDDSDDDLLLVRVAFSKTGMKNRVISIEDPEEAISYFEGTGKYANRETYPLPGLVLLDIKMPRRDGFEILKWLRERPQFRALPVVMLTSSERLFDVTKAYELGANSYLVKPFEFENLEAMIRTLGAVWRQASQGPPGAVARPAANDKL